MGHCEHINTRGSKKGLQCGAYSTKSLNGRTLCYSHYKMHNRSNPPQSSSPTQQAPPPTHPPAQPAPAQPSSNNDALNSILKRLTEIENRLQPSHTVQPPPPSTSTAPPPAPPSQEDIQFERIMTEYGF